jgi:aminoglycoside phosphotransferase (APT) family kinase protein
MVLYREVGGTALDRLPAGPGPAAAALAAGWLARLHASDAVLARRLDLRHELGNVEEWAARVGQEVPDAQAAAHALSDRLAAAAVDLPAVRQVPVHKDFHAGHVLAVRHEPAAGGVPCGIAVLDLDEARMGDPALDVAHFATYLDLSPLPGAARARDVFLAGYGPLPGPSPELRAAFYSAYTCMKIAKQLVTGRGPLPSPPGHWQAATLGAVLSRGSTCLDG